MNKHHFIYLFITLISFLALIIAFVSGIQVGFTTTVDSYDKNILPTLSVIGVWFGSIATSSAVIVSLWLAFKQLSKDKEILEFRLNMLVIPGHQDKACIGVTILSKGDKPSIIDSITWHCSNSTISIYIQQFHANSAQLPAVLSYGQRINIIHEEDFEIHLSEYINEYSNKNLDSLYMTVNTTTESHKVKLTKDVKEEISAHL